MYRGRFAPSPTGQLHFGSLVAALGSWLRARACGGRWLVRVEDIDPPREVAGATRDILATLDACGLVSDEPVLLQSTRSEAYAAALERLRAAGRAFPCWCSRSDLAPFQGRHPPECIAPPAPGRACAWRVRVEPAEIAFEDGLQGRFVQNLARDVGPFVVRRVEGYYAYQLAVVVDDAAQGITEIVRGSDLLDSTPRQLWLQRLLDLPTPAYVHLPLALDAAGRKLSKQERALPVRRDDPLPALRAALRFLGQQVDDSARTPTQFLQNAVQHFRLERIPHTGFVPVP